MMSRFLLAIGLALGSAILVASPLYPKTLISQHALGLERGFSDLTEAGSAYAFDQCAFPTLMAQVTPDYAFLPVESGKGTWSVGVNGGGSQGYVCYTASSGDKYALARQSVKTNHIGLVVADSCGALVDVAVSVDVEVLTWWLPAMVFPDDCVTGP